MERDIKSMSERGLISLAIIICVCIMSIALLPAGTAPYTAVYGPASALRAQRAFLLLAFAVASVLWLAAAWALTRFFPLSALGPVIDPSRRAADFSSVPCSLRC
jgi:hypothetical protein